MIYKGDHYVVSRDEYKSLWDERLARAEKFGHSIFLACTGRMKHRGLPIYAEGTEGTFFSNCYGIEDRAQP